MSNKELTDKEIAFVDSFTLTGNATQSAIQAGYSSATAKQQGYQLKKRLVEEINLAARDA